MRKWLDGFASPIVTVALVAPGAVLYVLYMVLTGGRVVTLSSGFDVMSGGTDIALLAATSPIMMGYFVVLAAHLLARCAIAVRKARMLPDAETVDSEEILADSHAYSVIVAEPDWADVVDCELTGMSATFSDDGRRALFQSSAHPVARNAWKFAVWLLFLSMLVSWTFREATYIRLGDGQLIEAPIVGDVFRYDWRYTAEEASISVPVAAMGIVQGGVTAGYDESGTPIPTRLLSKPVTAQVVLGDASARAYPVTMWPPTVIGATFVSIVEFGPAPHLVVTVAGQPVTDRYASVFLAPTGRPQSAQIDLAEVGAMLRLTTRPGQPVPYGTYDAELVGPDRSVIASGLVGAGASIEASGVVIAIPDTQWWVGLSIVRDPGLWLGLLSVVLIFVTLAVRVWVAFAGTERYSFALADTEHGERLYAGVVASALVRRRAAARLRALVRELESERGGAAR